MNERGHGKIQKNRFREDEKGEKASKIKGSQKFEFFSKKLCFLQNFNFGENFREKAISPRVKKWRKK